jgi:hypothetical protein
MMDKEMRKGDPGLALKEAEKRALQFINARHPE